MSFEINKENILTFLEQFVNGIKVLFDNQFPDLKQEHKNYVFFGAIILGFFLISKLVSILFKFMIVIIVGAFAGFYIMRRIRKKE